MTGAVMLEFDSSAPILVFGGPYSNLRATDALIQEAARRGIGPDRIICTGDIVAYCAEPEETARRIRDFGCHVIQGNCEQQLAAGAQDCACNFEAGSTCDLLAKGWYPFADTRVSASTRDWMGGLPQTMHFQYAGLTFRVIHGGVDEVSRWVFASDKVRLAEEAARAATDVIIAGHCGLPFISTVGRRVWFNPGVIGMPANDGTPDIWYGLVEARPDGPTLSTHRLTYNHIAASAAMRKYGYANGYARSLITGLWPSLDILPEAERHLTGKRIRTRILQANAPARTIRLTA